jgi:hypothetical protein
MNSPDDAIGSLVQGVPTDPDRLRALADTLRGTNVLGNLGLASGDRVMAPEGKSLIGQADAGAEDIWKQHAAMMSDQRQREMQQALFGNRVDLEQMRDKNRIDVAKMRAAQVAAGKVPEDPEVEAFMGRVAMSNMQLGGRSTLERYRISRAILDGYGYDPQKNPGAMDQAVLDMQNNKFGQASQLAQMRIVGNQVGRIKLGMEEMEPFVDKVKAGYLALDRGNFLALNKLENFGLQQFQNKDPRINALNQDVTNLLNSYRNIQARSTGVDAEKDREIMRQALINSQSPQGAQGTLDGMMYEGLVARKAGEKAQVPTYQPTMPPLGARRPAASALPGAVGAVAPTAPPAAGLPGAAGRTAMPPLPPANLRGTPPGPAVKPGSIEERLQQYRQQMANEAGGLKQ